MSTLAVRAGEAHDLAATVALMALGFPGAHKFSEAFLRWQYYANPLGAPLICNAWSDAQLVGHLTGIPARVTLRGETRLVTVIMNIAVHPAERGRGVLKTLTEHVIAQSAAAGHAGVIGVANQNSVDAFVNKLGFQNVAGLDAWLEWLPCRLDARRALDYAELAHAWSDATLAWRMANPSNRLAIVDATPDSLVVEGASGTPLLRARAVIPRAGVTLAAARRLVPRPAVVIGLAPGGALQRRGAIDIPARLRPSPLRLIWFAHDRAVQQLRAERVLFNFLDFDAF